MINSNNVFSSPASTIPNEVLVKILSHLDERDLEATAVVNKQWQRMTLEAAKRSEYPVFRQRLSQLSLDELSEKTVEKLERERKNLYQEWNDVKNLKTLSETLTKAILLSKAAKGYRELLSKAAAEYQNHETNFEEILPEILISKTWVKLQNPEEALKVAVSSSPRFKGEKTPDYIEAKTNLSHIIQFIGRKMIKNLIDDRRFKEAIELAHTILPDAEFFLRSYIAKKLANNHKFEKAIELAQGMAKEIRYDDKAPKKDRVISYIAKKLADNLMFEKLIEQATSISDQKKRRETLASIADIFKKRGMFEETIEVIYAYLAPTAPYYFFDHLHKLFEKLLEKRGFAAALEFANREDNVMGFLPKISEKKENNLGFLFLELAKKGLSKEMAIVIDNLPSS